MSREARKTAKPWGFYALPLRAIYFLQQPSLPIVSPQIVTEGTTLARLLRNTKAILFHVDPLLLISSTNPHQLQARKPLLWASNGDFKNLANIVASFSMPPPNVGSRTTNTTRSRNTIGDRLRHPDFLRHFNTMPP